MKLLFVNPYFKNKVYAPTLGLGFLATYIKNHVDCEVEIIEPVKERLDRHHLLEKIKNINYLGLTCYTESRFQCFDFAEQAKKINPNCKIIVGGPHATALDVEILKHYSFIDIVVRREGEEVLLKILKNYPLDQINGITWRKDNEVVQNYDQVLEENLDLFYLDYSFIYPEIYKWKDNEIPYKFQRLKNLPIIASRGCPFRCAFCAASRQWAGIWRGVSPDKLFEEIKFLVNRYEIRYFRFYDALFIGDEAQIFKFCDLLEQYGLDIKFRIDIRVGTSRAVLKRLREVGCEVVGFGIESGSDKVLQIINKRITRKQIEETIDICRSLNFWMIGFFMISLPEETPEDFDKTVELFDSFDVFNLQFFKIHPNTAFYEELKKRGEINDEIWFDKNYEEEIYYSRELFKSAKFSRRATEIMIKRFYIRHNLKNPTLVIKRFGLANGLFVLTSSLVQWLLLKNKISAKFLELMKGYKY